MPIQNADYSNISFEDMALAIGLKAKHIPMLVTSFIEENKEAFDSLQSAIDSRDFTAIYSRAHYVKGSAGNLRFKEVYEMAKEMEFAAKNSQEEFDYLGYFDAMKSAIATIPN